MNARLCERLDTWYRPEPFEVTSLLSPYTLQPNYTYGSLQDDDEE